MVLTEKGVLTNYKAPDIGVTAGHILMESEFPTRDAAIEAYSKCVNADVWALPRSLILVEEHHVDINWDE